MLYLCSGPWDSGLEREKGSSPLQSSSHMVVCQKGQGRRPVPSVMPMYTPEGCVSLF